MELRMRSCLLNTHGGNCNLDAGVNPLYNKIMSDIKDNETPEKPALPKVVVFDENNNVQLAEEGKTILAFVMGDDGVKIALNGYVTEVLLETIKSNMPNIMDNLIADFKKQAKKQDEDKNNIEE